MRKFLDGFYNPLLLRRWRVRVAPGLVGNGRIWVRNFGELTIGENFRFNSGPNFNVIGGQVRLNFVVRPQGSLSIGKNVGISNSTIVCSKKIIIEDGVTIGGDCRIYDTDFHSLQYEERMLRKDDPGIASGTVTIQKMAFIGASTIILKGVTIGERSVVGAGSVVAKSVPAGEVWGGNPAKFIRRLL